MPKKQKKGGGGGGGGGAKKRAANSKGGDSKASASRKAKGKSGGNATSRTAGGLRQLAQQLYDVGLYIRSVGADGNCLFRAVADQVRETLLQRDERGEERRGEERRGEGVIEVVCFAREWEMELRLESELESESEPQLQLEFKFGMNDESIYLISSFFTAAGGKTKQNPKLQAGLRSRRG